MSDAPDTRPRRYANGMARREAVLNAALELFVSRSVGGTTTRQIAVAAGLSQTGLRRHFRDKDEILLVLIERFLQAGEDQTGRSRSIRQSPASRRTTHGQQRNWYRWLGTTSGLRVMSRS